VRKLLLFVVAALSACSSTEQHFVAGSIISSAVTSYTGNQFLGCGAAIGSGLLKEVIDSAGFGVADSADIYSTSAGGCTLQLSF
jgi:hypothetical protein